MRGATSRVFPGLGRCSDKKPVESCKANKGVSKVEIIDLDDDDVVIDLVDTEQPQSRGSSTFRQNRDFSTVIDIDDDASSDTDTVYSVEDVGDLDSDATSSKSWFSASNYRWGSMRSDRDRCEVVQEKGFSSERSKRKQNHYSTASHRGYGLHSEFEYDSSDSDYSDCEVIEGSLLHEQWKNASQKRKNVHKCQTGLEDEASGSGSHGDTVDVENGTEQHAGDPVCSSSDHRDNEKESPPAMGTCNNHMDGRSFEAKMKTSSVESNQNVTKDTFAYARPGLAKETESLHRNNDFQHVRGTVPDDPHSRKSQAHHNDGFSGFRNEEQSPQEHSPWSSEELAAKQSKYSMHNEQKLRDETCFYDSLPRFNTDRGFPGVFSEELSNQNLHPAEVITDHSKVELGSKGGEFQEESRFEKKVKLGHGQPLGETYFDSGISEDVLGAVLRDSRVHVDKSEISNEKDVSQGNVGADSEDVFCCNSSFNISNQLSSVSASGNQSPEARDQLHTQDGNVTPVQNNIITDREKLKETDEYKQAMEEEMESRRKVLQIQAEEAQRLRKRKKAESMRLLDMQKRQKQRVEEVRETQKKDEENLNMKDKLRAEIRKELNGLSSCHSMAALLRGMGIQVGSGVPPLPKEVHAAYKRALLKFHPDRASRTDMRQMVEAEEKFKLICRMKEKLISTTWY